MVNHTRSRSTCRLELTERESTPRGTKDILQPQMEQCQGLEDEIRDKSCQRRSIHEENIVFIEERKILVIPKSKTMSCDKDCWKTDDDPHFGLQGMMCHCVIFTIWRLNTKVEHGWRFWVVKRVKATYYLMLRI